MSWTLLIYVVSGSAVVKEVNYIFAFENVHLLRLISGQKDKFVTNNTTPVKNWTWILIPSESAQKLQKRNLCISLNSCVVFQRTDTIQAKLFSNERRC